MYHNISIVTKLSVKTVLGVDSIYICLNVLKVSIVSAPVFKDISRSTCHGGNMENGALEQVVNFATYNII